jgi:ADP-dependent NAD(P)H-hydrate dehydratase
MTVGGSGDTLSGVTAALLSKVDSPFSASIRIYFTGKAASMAYKNIGLHMVATDIIDKLPEAVKPFDKLKDLDNMESKYM